ncbi:low molecular weight protein-tyrosine-phosphatase [Ruegeria arenilitoris]|uniref:low molecular weight protein-tyrosine-phosphatase n=1 Tax=Ruegeria arenilitoris TaxID=1173585 RepID=UPI00147FEC05|nr:low molecular weight protein-tyrosine-phosphatase [Ruegeria arenilitoris]
MTRRILFVCLGNICRSPAAQGVFRTIVPTHTVDSAGTSGWHIGRPPYAPMQEAALARGIDLSDLRARQFLASDFELFDLIIGMDRDNIADIEALRPPGMGTPVRLLTDFSPHIGKDHIPDPYYTGDFEGAFYLIETATKGLHDHLTS